MQNGMTRIFFASDIHGSERTFRKWLTAAGAHQADVVIFGGDLTGKILQPIVGIGAGRYGSDLFGHAILADGPSELEQLRTRIRNAGRYEVIVSTEEKRALDDSPELVHQTFLRAARESAQRWLELADRRLSMLGIPAYMMLGNDDFREMQDIFDQATLVINPEDNVVELPGGYEMISLGYSNPTPWDSPRELSEVDLASRIDKMAKRLKDPTKSVFNFHVPPHGTHLDRAPLLDDRLTPIIRGGQLQIGNVGSTAVLDVLRQYAPLLSLHGHIHESPGMSKVGRTIAINPGSEYADGILRGALVTLDKARGVRGWQLVQG